LAKQKPSSIIKLYLKRSGATAKLRTCAETVTSAQFMSLRAFSFVLSWVQTTALPQVLFYLQWPWVHFSRVSDAITGLQYKHSMTCACVGSGFDHFRCPQKSGPFKPRV
jgi:hypothetical protein